MHQGIIAGDVPKDQKGETNVEKRGKHDEREQCRLTCCWRHEKGANRSHRPRCRVGPTGKSNAKKNCRKPVKNLAQADIT